MNTEDVSKYRLRRIIICALSSVVAIGLGCGNDPATEVAPTTDVKIANIPEKAPEVSAEEKKKETAIEWRYSSVGKRDPFRSYLADVREAETSQNVRKLEATEHYELSQYRLTGVITGTSRPKAMVEDPEGQGHVLRIGTRVGRNGGRVTRISDKGLMILEEYRDPTGKRVRVPVRVPMRIEQEEEQRSQR